MVDSSMTFSDDDLKRLKDDAERDRRIGLWSADRIIALIARLEAAEKYAEEYAEPTNRDYQAWRKAAGK